MSGTKITTVQAREQFAEVINRVAYGKERVVLTRRGKPVAAVVPVEDAQLLDQIEDRLDIEEARLALAEAQAEGTIPWEEIKAELGL